MFSAKEEMRIKGRWIQGFREEILRKSFPQFLLLSSDIWHAEYKDYGEMEAKKITTREAGKHDVQNYVEKSQKNLQ